MFIYMAKKATIYEVCGGIIYTGKNLCLIPHRGILAYTIIGQPLLRIKAPQQ